jgi:hypothetical protein
MGRGLSPLQRWIMREVETAGKLYYVDIYTRYFGWQPTSRAWSKDGQHFSPTSIGLREYRRVVATVSRSCKRLEQRGLVYLGHRLVFPPRRQVDLQRQLQEAEQAIRTAHRSIGR